MNLPNAVTKVLRALKDVGDLPNAVKRPDVFEIKVRNRAARRQKKVTN